LIPNAAVFGVLVDPAIIAIDTTVIPDLQAAARTLGLQLVVVYAATDSDLETAFATFSQRRVSRTFSTGGLNRRFWGIAEARKRVGSKGRVLESSVV